MYFFNYNIVVNEITKRPRQRDPMRLQDVKISETDELMLDIMELPLTCALIISEGKAKLVELPSHAQTSIDTYKGKVKRVNFDEGEEF